MQFDSGTGSASTSASRSFESVIRKLSISSGTTRGAEQCRRVARLTTANCKLQELSWWYSFIHIYIYSNVLCREDGASSRPSIRDACIYIVQTLDEIFHKHMTFNLFL